MNRSVVPATLMSTVLVFGLGCTLPLRPSTPEVTTECGTVRSLSASGQHLPAIEYSRSLERSISRCPEETREALSHSYSVVNRADSRVRLALSERKKGNLRVAREELEESLAIYPRYYWVKNLLRGVNSSIETRVRELREESAYLEERGDRPEAASRLRAALELSPEHEELQNRLARLEEHIDHADVREDARDTLRHARDLLHEGRFREAERVVLDGQAQELLPEDADKTLTLIHKQRTESAQSHLNRARAAVENGDLEDAVHFIQRTSTEGPFTEPLRTEFGEFSRNLGTTLYARGNLHDARTVWLHALGADPGDERTLAYLEEVEIRLDRLRRIREHQEFPTERGEVGDAPAGVSVRDKNGHPVLP